MMKLSSKIDVNPITYFLILVTLLSGLFKYLVVIFIIVIIHETGHIIISLIFKRNITKIVIYPFGGLVKMDASLSENIYEELLINIGGILFQLLLIFLLNILYRLNLINRSTLHIFNYYNTLIMGFNLIPVCPLDGYKIIKNIIELFTPYKRTFYIALLLSIVSLLFIFSYSYNQLMSNTMVIVFIIISTISEYKSIKYLMNRFYLERMNQVYDFKRRIKINRIDNMYKNRINIIKGYSEGYYLNRYYFHKK